MTFRKVFKQMSVIGVQPVSYYVMLCRMILSIIQLFFVQIFSRLFGIETAIYDNVNNNNFLYKTKNGIKVLDFNQNSFLQNIISQSINDKTKVIDDFFNICGKKATFMEN
jgi:hypothetical protein